MLLVAVALLVLVAVFSGWWIKYNLYASPFDPTRLNEEEARALDAKLDLLERSARREGGSLRPAPTGQAAKEPLVPERYTEDAARREIRITEKELNALIARDEETSRHVAIHLADDLVSVKLVIPFDNDVPLFGGKTLRLNCGVTIRHEAGRPVVALRGVSLGGVPIPNAWLGNIKNIDLVREFGDQRGFWQVFSEGVEAIKVSDRSLFIKLRE